MRVRLLLAALVAMGLAGCGQPPERATPTGVDAPTPLPVQTPLATAIQGWRTSSPEQQGMDSAQLARLFEAIHERVRCAVTAGFAQ